MNDRLPRKLAAILYADVAGYSRLTGEDEDATHRVLTDYLDLIAAKIESQGGEVMHYAGDAVLARFSAVVDALSAAVAIQDDLQTRNATLPDARKVQFRIGLNLGDVIEDRGDIYGDGVNVAARLEALAQPGSICISDAVRTAVGNKLSFQYEFIGEQRVKNIEEPVRAYHVSEIGASPATSTSKKSKSVTSTMRSPGKPSLVIKPFENMSTDPEQDYFAEGLTQDITIALVKIPGLFLTMDETPSYNKSRQMTAKELGREFGVQYVLKGSVRKLGNRVRVNADLIDSSSGQHVWAERFDRELHDLFAIQDEITEEIVTAMDVKLLAGEEGRYFRQALKNPAALDTSYRGWHLLFNGTTKHDIQESQSMFEEVIRLEPKSPLGYTAAALAYWSEAASGTSNSRSLAWERAKNLALEALNLGDTTGYSHLILAMIHLSNHEYDEAMTEATDGVADRPSCNGAYAIKASVLNYLGHPAEAIEFAQYAVRLTPVYPPYYPAILASAYHDSGRHEEALAAARAAIELSDDKVEPYLTIAASSDALGRVEDAHWAVQEALRVKPDFNLAEYAESQPYREQKDLDCLVSRLRNAGLA
jgi:adenylate cyclase